MTEAVFDFAAINRRLNRKQEPLAEALPTFMTLDYSGHLVSVNPDGTTRTWHTQSVAALRAEVEQMERDQDILALRLKADEAMKHAREQARTAVFDEFGSRDELMKLWGA